MCYCLQTGQLEPHVNLLLAEWFTKKTRVLFETQPSSESIFYIN